MNGTSVLGMNSIVERARDAWRLSGGELLIVVGFWAAFAALGTASHTLRSHSLVRPLSNVEEAGFWLLYAVQWIAITPVVFALAGRVADPWRRMPRALLLIAAGTAFVAVLPLARGLVWSGILGMPMLMAPTETPTVRGFLFRPWFVSELVTFTAVVAVGLVRGRVATDRLRQAQLAESRLAQLRQQLNPHFLFNTLHAMSALVARDADAVRGMIAGLSELLRYAIDDTVPHEIPLREELRLLHCYLGIAEVRYRGRLHASVRTLPALDHALVPTMILQPIVENAVKHGIARSGGHGRIDVHVTSSHGELILTITNSSTAPVSAGDTGHPRREGAGVGLRNTRARLEALYGDSQALTLRDLTSGGAMVEIRIPLKLGHRHRQLVSCDGAGEAHHG